MVESVVGCCTTWLSSSEWAFLIEDAPLAFTQPSTFCKATESFQTSGLPVDRFIRPFWKTSPGQWDTMKDCGLIWLAGHARRVTVAAAGRCGIFWGDLLLDENPPGPWHCRCLSVVAYSMGLGLPYSRWSHGWWPFPYSQSRCTPSSMEFWNLNDCIWLFSNKMGAYFRFCCWIQIVLCFAMTQRLAFG